MEQQLRRRESELVGFAGVVAHDLRSPLARITGYADLLREEVAPRLAPDHSDFLERPYRGTQRMQSLIDSLLNFSTADNRPLQVSEIDLHQLVDEIIKERIAGPVAQPSVVIVGPLPVMHGDAILLRQVFDNLIGNALKYTRPDRPAHIELSSHREGDHWRTVVTDRGIGIPLDQRDTIFTAFTRTDGSEQYPGSGLGRAIVHRIVERHGGRAGGDANPGGVGRFWFTLDQIPPTPAATQRYAATSTPDEAIRRRPPLPRQHLCCVSRAPSR